MKKLLVILMAACFCLVPVAALAQNAHPHVYLEIYDMPTDTPPANICVHPSRPAVDFPCYNGQKTVMHYGFVPLHVGKLDVPMAPGLGQPGGGYCGLSYGISANPAGNVIFMSYVDCPGWLKGPGTAPGAIVTGSTALCHDWVDHAGYCKFLTTDPVPVHFTIVNNADENWVRVINCLSAYDVNTIVGEPPLVSGQAQWGGTQDIVCGADPTAVDLTTWGKIKGLYR